MNDLHNPGLFPAVPGFDEVLLAKFSARIDAGDWSTGPCWNWTGYCTPKGYGVFGPRKKVQYRAHRFALQAYLGRQPAEMVLHKCDNPSCVNPHHLMEGSHGENMRQMAERRRAAREERHHNAKLIAWEVVSIVLLNKGGDYTCEDLAGMFGVSKPTIIGVCSGRLWPDQYAIADAMLAERAKHMPPSDDNLASAAKALLRAGHMTEADYQRTVNRIREAGASGAA